MSLLLAFVSPPAAPAVWAPAVALRRQVEQPYRLSPVVLVVSDATVAPTWVPVVTQRVIQQAYRQGIVPLVVSDVATVPLTWVPQAFTRATVVLQPRVAASIIVFSPQTAEQWVPPPFLRIQPGASYRTTFLPTPSQPLAQPDSLAFLVPQSRSLPVSTLRLLQPTRVFGPDGSPPVIILTGPRFDVFLPDSGSARSFSVAITGTTTRGVTGSQTSATRSTTGTVTSNPRGTTGSQTGTTRGTSGTSTPATGRQ